MVEPAAGDLDNPPKKFRGEAGAAPSLHEGQSWPSTVGWERGAQLCHVLCPTLIILILVGFECLAHTDREKRAGRSPQTVVLGLGLV